MKRLITAVGIFACCVTAAIGDEYVYFANYQDNSLSRIGGGGLEPIPVTGNMVSSSIRVAPSEEGHLLWYEQMEDMRFLDPYSLMARSLENLEENNTRHLYDPDAIAITLHVCDKEGKDLATVPIPVRHGFSISHASFPASNVVSSFFNSRVADYLHSSLVVRIDSGEIFSANTSVSHGLYISHIPTVSPDGRWVIQPVEFHKSILLLVNGQLVAPVTLPLDWTASPEQFDAEVKAVKDTLRERHRYYVFSGLVPRSAPFYPGDTRLMVLEIKVGPIEEGRSFDDLKRAATSDDPDAPPPTPYNPELWEMNGLFLVDLEALTTGGGEWTDAIVRELPGLGFTRESPPAAFWERTGSPDLLCVDAEGRVYYIAEKSRLDDTPDRRWYFTDIEGNRLTPDGERVQ